MHRKRATTPPRKYGGAKVGALLEARLDDMAASLYVLQLQRCALLPSLRRSLTHNSATAPVSFGALRQHEPDRTCLGDSSRLRFSQCAGATGIQEGEAVEHPVTC